MNWKQNRGVIAELLDLAVKLLALLEENAPEKSAGFSIARSQLHQLRKHCLREHNGSAEIWLKSARLIAAPGTAGEMLDLAIGFAEQMEETERKAEIARQEAEEKRKIEEEEAEQKRQEAHAAALQKEADRKAEEVRKAEDQIKKDREAREQRRVAAEKTRKEEADAAGNRKAVIDREAAAATPSTEPAADSSG